MTSRMLIFLLGACATLAAEAPRVNLDASILAQIPAKRHAALILFAITDRDSTPAISEKKAKYVDALKALILDLRSAYYWHAEFPKNIDEAIVKRAVDLAGLHYPASPTTGASGYADLVQSYTIRMYEGPSRTGSGRVFVGNNGHAYKISHAYGSMSQKLGLTPYGYLIN